jgi:hypothetical protein
MPTAREYITRIEAAERLKTTVRTLERQFAERTGPYAIKVGRLVRYPLDERGVLMPWPDAQGAPAHA